jgi:hypothetical protein
MRGLTLSGYKRGDFWGPALTSKNKGMLTNEDPNNGVGPQGL